MADVDQIEVFPLKDGTWDWRRREGGRTKGAGDGYSARAEAIAAARASRGDETLRLVRADGSDAGTVRVGGGLRIVLLRLDGSEVGELDHAMNPESSNMPQSVNIVPAGESDHTREVEG